jgi:predicted GNAT family acetyltransferase
MVSVQFSPYRVVEYADPRQYNQVIGKWMLLREAENCYLLGSIPDLINSMAKPNIPKARLFAVLEGDHIAAAAVLFPGGCLVITWATLDMLQMLTEGLLSCKVQITSVYAPAHVSWQFSKMWAERTQQSYAFDRAERIYQLSRVVYTPPDSGRMELATFADAATVTPWIEGFTREAGFEHNNVDAVRDTLISLRQLYLWKTTEPVAMAAWVSPTPNGGSINMVYTPPNHRGKGHGTAIVAALGRYMLANGRQFCFIMTEPNDHGSNKLYQRVGARTLCELLRCTIGPAQAQPPSQPEWNGSWVG